MMNSRRCIGFAADAAQRDGVGDHDAVGLQAFGHRADLFVDRHRPLERRDPN
jgi:hypothetical protein